MLVVRKKELKMLQEIKFDLHKIIKSRTLIFSIIISALIVLLKVVYEYLLAKNLGQRVLTGFMNNNMVFVAVTLFAVVFCTKDYSSMYIKNVYTNVNKLKYTLSKMACLFLFVVAVLLYAFILELVFNFIFGGGVIYNDGSYHWMKRDGFYYVFDNDAEVYTISGFIVATILQAVGLTAYGMLINLVATLCNGFVTAIITFAWYSFYSVIYSAISGLISTIFKLSWPNLFEASRYLIMYKLGCPLEVASNSSAVVEATITFSVYLIVATLLSWLALSKKEF